MDMETERRRVRAGGWAALGVASLGVARLGMAAHLAVSAAAGRPVSDARGWELGLAAAAAVAALCQALAVQGLRMRLRPDTRLILTVSTAGWAGAAFGLAGAGLIAFHALQTAAPATASGLLLGWLAAFTTALWTAGACAADWRRGRLPAWLRIVGTVFAVASLAAAVLLPFNLLAVPLGFVWWLGLGVVLLRAARPSTSG